MAKKKLVIWDLDNTIWQGVLAEGDELILRQGIVEIIRELDNRGILQSIASKNEYERAYQQLKEFGIDQYFIYPMINWKAKSENIKSIVSSINISFDSVMFVDDQYFELSEVGFSLPEVVCINAKNIDNLLECDDLKPTFITDDSKIRRQLYQNQIIRDEAEKSFIGTKEEFLKTLSMVMKVQKAEEEDLCRAEELTIRTHQLNSTGYTYSYDELKNFCTNDAYDLLVVDLNDKYGYYGKIGLALIEKEAKKYTLKLLITSCRVMNRGIGTVLLGLIINRTLDNDCELYAEFVPTKSNRIMAITYSMLGFHIDTTDAAKQILKYTNNTKVNIPEYVSIISDY